LTITAIPSSPTMCSFARAKHIANEESLAASSGLICREAMPISQVFSASAVKRGRGSVSRDCNEGRRAVARLEVPLTNFSSGLAPEMNLDVRCPLILQERRGHRGPKLVSNGVRACQPQNGLLRISRPGHLLAPSRFVPDEVGHHHSQDKREEARRTTQSVVRGDRSLLCSGAGRRVVGFRRWSRRLPRGIRRYRS
jgi:hypothetical protein